MSDLDIMDCIADILLQVLLDDDNAQLSVAQSGYLDELMAFLDDSVCFRDYEVDDEDVEKLKDIKRTISKVIVYATSSGKKRSMYFIRILMYLIFFFSLFYFIKKTIDTLIAPLYNDEAFLRQLFKMAKSKSEVLHQTAIYIIGNLARTGIIINTVFIYIHLISHFFPFLLFHYIL